MFTLGHLSDIHLAPLPRPAIHELVSKRALGYMNWRRRRMHHRREVLDRLVEDLLARSPDHIAMTGDLVNIALPEEFRVVRRWLDETGGPETITVIPGNHDAYVPFLREPGISKWAPYMAANDEGLQFADQHGHAFPFRADFRRNRTDLPVLGAGDHARHGIGPAGAAPDAARRGSAGAAR